MRMRRRQGRQAQDGQPVTPTCARVCSHEDARECARPTRRPQGERLHPVVREGAPALFLAGFRARWTVTAGSRSPASRLRRTRSDL